MIKYVIVGEAGVKSVKVINFPGGEVGVRLEEVESEAVNNVEQINIFATLQNSDEIFVLLLLVDALRRQYIGVRIQAYLPYMPYARQDRVCNPGESLSAAVMANLINLCGFEAVLITDPHSDVIPALINNAVIERQDEVFGKLRSDWSNIYIVAPDAGASKKAQIFAEKVGAAGVVQCMKKRNVETGKLSGFVCIDEIEGKHLFVLDDICDGGGTFLGLSEILRPKAAKLELAVTHGIFSKGVEVVANAFDHVYTTNSFTGKLIKAPNVTCIDVLALL